MMTKKITKMTSHYALKNDQNDQLMIHFSGKLSGHYVITPKKIAKMTSLDPQIGP